MAARDLAWGTVPGSIVRRKIDAGDAGFIVVVELVYREAQIAFSSLIEIHGHEDGTIEYSMRGQALEAFEFAKIGLNIHHPIAGLVGRRWEGVSPDGEWAGSVPRRIYPQIHLRAEGWDLPIFPPVHELRLDHEVGTVRLDFGGHPYEMEDQRNWGDHSLKTYSMPAEIGYRHQVAKGAELAERIRFSFTARRRRASGRGRGAGPPTRASARIQVGPPTGRRMPPIGLTQAGPLAEELAVPIELVRPAYLRLEVDLAADEWAGQLAVGLDACARVRAGAELAIFVARDPRVALTKIASLVRSRAVAVNRVLVFLRDEDATPPGWTEVVRESLAIDAPVGGGAHLNFAELNRAWPDMRGYDVVSYPVSPQVHATDDLSIVENLEALGEQVRTARARAGRREVAVGPVTLEPRWRMAPVPDPRHSELFGAAWMLGAIKMLAEAGAGSVTLGESTGARGVVDFAGSVGALAHPSLHVLGDAAALCGSEIVSCNSGEEPWLCALAAAGPERTTILVANLSDIERRIALLVPDHSDAQVRILDDAGLQRARHEYREFRSDLASLGSDELELTLGPYATAYVEVR